MLEFADRFRTLEDVCYQDKHAFIHCQEKSFGRVEDFVFKNLVSGLEPFLDPAEIDGAYFETLPFSWMNGCWCRPSMASTVRKSWMRSV
ncbi:hypothetical protein ACFTAO_50905 [Paenibacillus rhizoplanae]